MYRRKQKKQYEFKANNSGVDQTQPKHCREKKKNICLSHLRRKSLQGTKTPIEGLERWLGG